MNGGSDETPTRMAEEEQDGRTAWNYSRKPEEGKTLVHCKRG